VSAKSVTVADACRMIADRTGDQQAAHILRQAGNELDRLTADLAKHQPEEREGKCWCVEGDRCEIRTADNASYWVRRMLSLGHPGGDTYPPEDAEWHEWEEESEFCCNCGAHLCADGTARRNADAALLDALERLALESAEHGEAVEIDARAIERLGVIGLSAWPEGTVVGEEWVGPDLRAAIRAALGQGVGEDGLH
jgi:hypothetical protein